MIPAKDFVEESATSIKNDFLTTRIQFNRVYKNEDHLTPSDPDRAFFASLIHRT